MNLSLFNTASLFEAATSLFSQLGIRLSSNTAEPLPARELLKSHYKDNDTFNAIASVYFIGIIDDSIFKQPGMFDAEYSLHEALQQADKNYDGLMLFALGLKKHPTRTEISDLTRAFNRISQKMPVALVLKYAGDNEAIISIAISERFRYKQNWRQGEKAGKVIILRDIHTTTTHTGHQRILLDLVKPAGITTYEQLHAWWLQALDVNLLNKKFYREVFDWYLWAFRYAKFPQIRPEEDMLKDEQHQSESLIRLLTRLLFCWFMKEKKLISDQLFNKAAISGMLVNLDDDDSTYYKAILQNLFFATLNKPVEERKVINEGFNPLEYGDPLVYRYKQLFKQPENLVSYFQNIPFLNGGLFDCLDRKKDDKNPHEIRLDGFSTKPSKQPTVPNKLFFGRYSNVDLSTEYDDRKKQAIEVRGIIDIFSSYKFTIEESTPVEEEIALDPELLGKVFENLLASYNPETKTTARKQTGSFYTPREIVNYMVDESLTEYLKSKVDNGETHESLIRSLVSYDSNDVPVDANLRKQILRAINDCRVLDPACGSGAFPMGVLQRMIHILKKIDPDNRVWLEMVISNFPDYLQNEMRQKLSAENWDYVRKLGIIQECIYGIDIQPIAIQISKLRFFISLLVDQKEKPGKPNRGFDPLPNLDFKLVAANTLIGTPQTETITTGLFSDAEDEFETQFKKLTSQYFSTYKPADKKKKKEEIENLITAKVNDKINHVKSLYHSADSRVQDALKAKKKTQIQHGENEIKLWSSYANLFKNESVGFFDTRYFFPQIKEGFDIVIGNPPYVAFQRMEGEMKKELQSQKYKTFENTGDIYALFYEKGYDLLRKGGILVFITSRQWMQASYGSSLRRFLSQETNPLQLIDFGQLKIFEGATVFVNILLFEKSCFNNKLKACQIPINFDFEKRDLKFFFSENKNNIQKLNDSTWMISNSLDVIEKIEQKGRRIGNWKVLEFFRGYTTGLNEAFYVNKEVREKLIEYPINENIIKPLLRGKDIKRYMYSFEDWYVLNTHNGIKELEIPRVDVEKDYPIIHQHLQKWQPQLEERLDKGEHWTNLRNCAFLLEFEKPKIVWIEISDRANYAYDDKGYYLTNSAYFLTCNDDKTSLKYLLALLNSKAADYYFSQKTARIAGGRMRYTKQYVEQIPIPEIPLQDQQPFITLVDQILEAKKQNPQADTSQLENQIDLMVYQLYGLTEEEIGIIENKQ